MSLKQKIDCKEASFLISKKQETSLSLYEILQLRLHLIACDACRLFQLQTNTVLQILHKNQKQSPKKLSDADKKKLQAVLNHEIDR